MPSSIWISKNSSFLLVRVFALAKALVTVFKEPINFAALPISLCHAISSCFSSFAASRAACFPSLSLSVLGTLEAGSRGGSSSDGTSQTSSSTGLASPALPLATDFLGGLSFFFLFFNAHSFCAISCSTSP